ncbi:hypothetical protein EII38_09390 [Streptococcus minor]|uniref:DUF1366 domain-containing protein n=1 Tax=Streptococcus minor TaxID=229549 RepID=A0A3P1V813_9STRE|nr:hypothetical protein [Streptococcus minor]RRD29640.1 hypothetical protein EII38_09390 [Streptococcus minor]
MSNANYMLAYPPTMREPGKTTVAIKSEVNGYGYFERTLGGDRTQDSENDLIEAVLDVLRTELDPASALVKVQVELTQISEKNAEYDKLLAKAQKAIQELEEATEEAKQGAIRNEQAVNKAVSELTELITGVISQLSAEMEGEAT